MAKKKETKKVSKKKEVKTEEKQETAIEKVIPTDHKWYIVGTNSGQEKRVANLINQRVKANQMESEISEVVVPTQEKIVIKRGKKQTVEERIFPGYVLIKMKVSDTTLHLIRNTDGARGFIGTSEVSKNPIPLSEKEAKSILAFMEVKQPATFQSSYNVGDAVKVVEGPFKDFMGTIQEVNENKGQVTVLIEIFGRETPVELDFLQVTKVSEFND
jgi:transcriptional antiterminator NusG